MIHCLQLLIRHVNHAELKFLLVAQQQLAQLLLCFVDQKKANALHSHETGGPASFHAAVLSVEIGHHSRQASRLSRLSVCAEGHFTCVFDFREECM